jgi:hypothetical protein
MDNLAIRPFFRTGPLPNPGFQGPRTHPVAPARPQGGAGNRLRFGKMTEWPGRKSVGGHLGAVPSVLKKRANGKRPKPHEEMNPSRLTPIVLAINSKALPAYDAHKFKATADGDVFLAGAKPSEQDRNPIVAEAFDPKITLTEEKDGWWLEINGHPGWGDNVDRNLVSPDLLGQAQLPGASFETPDGKPYILDTGYFGKKWPENHPSPGPFAWDGKSTFRAKAWSMN